jgi:predicted phosphoribosyltransferase
MRDYVDRFTAGQQLAGAVLRLALTPPLVVLGLARGGVPVAVPVARALRAPLDVMLVRKLAAPWQPEFALGAIATGGVVVRDTSDPSLITPEEFDTVLAQQTRELERREQAYRAARPAVQLRGSTVVLVETVSPRAIPCWPPSARRARRVRYASWSPAPSAPPTRGHSSPPRRTTW